MVHEKTRSFVRSIQGISTGSILQNKKVPLSEEETPFGETIHCWVPCEISRNHFKKRAESSCPGVHKKPSS